MLLQFITDGVRIGITSIANLPTTNIATGSMGQITNLDSVTTLVNGPTLSLRTDFILESGVSIPVVFDGTRWVELATVTRALTTIDGQATLTLAKTQGGGIVLNLVESGVQTASFTLTPDS